MARERILVVDDEVNMRESLRDILAEEGYDVALAEEGRSALRALDDSTILIITDAKMPGMDGFELLREVHKRYPDLPVVMITAYGTMQLAVDAMRAGAYDYITKPFDPEQILHDLRNIVDHYRKTRENIRLKQRLTQEFDVSQIVGRSAQMNEILDVVRRVASTPSSVLIFGQSGTGKELVAKALHYLGDRASQPFVVVNCAAIPDTLLESRALRPREGRLHRRGRRQAGPLRAGRRRDALPRRDRRHEPSLAGPSCCASLQERVFERIGGRKHAPRRRAHRRRHEQGPGRGDAARREFREDLYYRINVITIRLPPLRERREDIPLLVEHFIRRYNYSTGKKIAGIEARRSRS